MISLANDEIRLRALEPEDLSIILSWENDPIYWTAGQQQIPYSAYLLREYLTDAGKDPYETGQLRLMICKEEASIGLIDFFDFDPQHQRGAIGILIGAQSAQGKGYAKQAMQLFLNYLFPTFNLRQVHVGIGADNKASIKLFENCGFKKYGTRVQWYRQGESFTDEHLYQLLKEYL